MPSSFEDEWGRLVKEESIKNIEKDWQRPIWESKRPATRRQRLWHALVIWCTNHDPLIYREYEDH